MTVDEAYDFCRRIAHKHGANFSVGFRFLPPQKRKAVYAAYAWCRVADDIADEPEDAGKATETRSAKLAELDRWQRELDACYEGRPAETVTIALADALRHFSIPKSAFIALLDGCRQDMVQSRYADFPSLLHYCELVAWSISDISLSIFGYRHDTAIAHGRHLATALQLTNVTRDVGDDLERDRIYLPADEMQAFGVSESMLIRREETPAVRALIESQIERAKGYFRLAEPLLRELDFDARFPTLLMGGVYATVLGKLERDPFRAVRSRISLSTARKLMVVGSRLVRPHFV